MVARRTLPGLRLYSSWFTKNWAILAAEIADESLRASIQELWRCYADMLTTLATLFPAELLPSIDYMLEEDAEAIGFKPLMSKLTRWIWYTGQDLRPRFSDSKVERSHPNDEMLVRIRDLLVNGLELAARTDDVSPHNSRRYIRMSYDVRRPYHLVVYDLSMLIQIRLLVTRPQLLQIYRARQLLNHKNCLILQSGVRHPRSSIPRPPKRTLLYLSIRTAVLYSLPLLQSLLRIWI